MKDELERIIKINKMSKCWDLFYNDTKIIFDLQDFINPTEGGRIS